MDLLLIPLSLIALHGDGGIRNRVTLVIGSALVLLFHYMGLHLYALRVMHYARICALRLTRIRQ